MLSKSMTINSNSVLFKNPNAVFFPLGEKYEGISILEKDSEKDIWVVNNNGEFFEGNFQEILSHCLILLRKIHSNKEINKTELPKEAMEAIKSMSKEARDGSSVG